MTDEIENKYFKFFPSDGEFKPLTKEQSLARAKNSLLQAWFDVMKASPWFRAMLGGYDSFLDGFRKEDRELAIENLKIFGDIRKQSFETWWMQKGFYVFAERVPYLPMRQVAVHYPDGIAEMSKDELGEDPEAFMRIDVPLNLSREALHQHLDKILDEIDRYEGKFNRWKYSTAELHFNREPRKNLDAAYIKYKIDVYTSYEKQLKKRNEYPLYMLCDHLNIPTGLTSEDYKNLSQNAIDQRKSDVVSEILKAARNIMANALFRNFPSTSDHPLATHFAFSELAGYVDKIYEPKFDTNVSRRNRKKKEIEKEMARQAAEYEARR